MKIGIHSQSMRVFRGKKKGVYLCRATQMEEVDAGGRVLN